MSAKELLPLVLFIAALPAAAQVYKCPDATGRTVIQQVPCAGGQKIDVKPATGAGTSDPDELRILQAIATARLTRGMTAAQVRSAWGAPTKINRSVGSYGVHEQWVYDRGNFRAQYVYLENGKVTGIQSPAE